MRGPAQTSDPTIKFLYQLIESIRVGKLLIPRFQRPLVWKWDQQSELLRSIKDGIPMGAIMVWHTSSDQVKSLTSLAGHALPEPHAGTPREYLLDGLQRLSTLFAALFGAGSVVGENGEARSALGYDLVEEVFVESFAPSKQPHVLPLEYLLDSVTLLRFQRGLTGGDADVKVQRADDLAKAFREYKVPVIFIASDELGLAVRTFNMVNHQGSPMEEADMIHALAWSPEFELRDRFESLRSEMLQPVGWGGIDLDTILKVVKAGADLSLYEESAEAVSKVLRDDPKAVDRAFALLVRVAELLNVHCGIRNWELVPYSVQAVLLADALREAGSRDVGSLLADWFWLTTYGEMFAGLSGYRLNLAIRDLRASVMDGKMRWSGASSFRLRPLRTSADFRAARMKAVALMLARQIDGPNLFVEPYQALAEQGKNALFALVPRALVSKDTYSSVGNRFLCDPSESQRLRSRVMDTTLDYSDREAHFISDAAMDAARSGNWDRFIHERLKRISEHEHKFVQDILQRHPSAE